MPDSFRPYRVRCACITRWVVDFGDDRGVQPATSMVAALASGVGLPVKLASVSSTPIRPIAPPGIVYGDSETYVVKNCEVCGWPKLKRRCRDRRAKRVA